MEELRIEAAENRKRLDQRNTYQKNSRKKVSNDVDRKTAELTKTRARKNVETAKNRLLMNDITWKEREFQEARIRFGAENGFWQVSGAGAKQAKGMENVEELYAAEVQRHCLKFLEVYKSPVRPQPVAAAAPPRPPPPPPPSSLAGPSHAVEEEEEWTEEMEVDE